MSTYECFKTLLGAGVKRAKIYEGPLGVVVFRVAKNDLLKTSAALEAKRPSGIVFCYIPDLFFFECRFGRKRGLFFSREGGIF